MLTTDKKSGSFAVVEEFLHFSSASSFVIGFTRKPVRYIMILMRTAYYLCLLGDDNLAATE